MPVGDIDFSWESFVNTTPPYMVFEYTAVGMFTGWDYNTGLEPYDPSATWLIASTSVPEPSTLYLLEIGAVCVYVMGHKRRERRTATTDG